MLLVNYKAHEPLLTKILIALITLVIAYIIYIRIDDYEKNDKYAYMYDNEYIDMDEIVKRGYASKFVSNNSPKQYTAIYMLSSMSCKICTGQIQIIDNLVKDGPLKNSFSTLLAIIDSNMARSYWYARVNSLEINTVTMFNEKERNVLLKYGKGYYDKQFIIYNNTKKRIVFRMKIKSDVSYTGDDMLLLLNNIMNTLNYQQI